jgi:phage FluMu gp28-like protein
MLSQPWYLDNMPKLKARFEDRTILIARDADVKSDFRQIRTVRGIPMVPPDASTKGTDGGQRHGDTAVAACLAVAAAEANAYEFGYRGVEARNTGSPGDWLDHPGDDAARQRPWWKTPLGAGLRGSV